MKYNHYYKLLFIANYIYYYFILLYYYFNIKYYYFDISDYYYFFFIYN